MKKIIAFLSVAAMLLLTCCSSTQNDDPEALAKYEEWVEKLSVITLDSEYDILGAESAYNGLSDSQKQKVSDETVVNARTVFENMKALQSMLPELCLKLENVFAPNNGVPLADFREDYEKAKEYVSGLTDAQKEEVGNVDRFIAAAEKYDACADSVKSLAELYVGAFLEYKKEESVAVTDIACIVNSRSGEMLYYYALRYKVGSEEKTVFANSPLTEETFMESVVHFGSTFFSEKPVSDGYNAFENGNYAIDAASVIDAAGK